MLAESAGDPLARSPVGAMGLLQFMPLTWRDCCNALGIDASPYNPRASTLCGGWYMSRLLRIFSAPRPWRDRLDWALSSYNWGVGNILKTQKRLYGQTEFRYIYPLLPAETRYYIDRNESIYQRLNQ